MGVLAVATTGLCLAVALPVVNVGAAAAAPRAVPRAPLSLPLGGAPGRTNTEYSGYFENLYGAVTLTTTLTVPKVRCANHATWGSQVGILALMTSSGTQVEHGGGVEVGCSSPAGTAAYAAALCDPDYAAGCGTPPGTVAPGDVVEVEVSATGGCNPTCTSASVTVTDTTQDWSASWSGQAQSDVEAFVALVGAAPVPDFGKVGVRDVTVNGAGFDGQRSSLADHNGNTLARASALSQAKTSFSVTWVRAA